MVLDMIFGGLVAMAHGLLRMAVRDERLMRRKRVIFFFIVFCCLAMMPRSVLVMLRGGGVVLCARKDVGHETSCVVFPIPGTETQYRIAGIESSENDAPT
ncbi:MAG: hypothetical protein ACRD9W_24295, partial [Terriglobia bacterium]